MEMESPAENRPQQLDVKHKSLVKPCGEMGAGEYPCEESNVARGALCGSHAPGERGDWATAVGDDSAGESTPEYLTPACSLFSLEFYCSTLEVFSSEQQPAVEEEEEPSRPSSSDEQRKECSACAPSPSPSPPPAPEELPDTASPSLTPVEALIRDIASPACPPDEEEELPVARIVDVPHQRVDFQKELPVAPVVDVPHQRVDFRNTPSTASLLSSCGHLFSQGYRYLTDDGSSCDASSSDLRSSGSGQPRGASYYSPCSPLFRCTSLLSEDCPSSPAAPPRGETSSVQSTVEIVHGLEEDPLATHVKQGTSRRRGKQLWAGLWTGLRRRFQQGALPRRQRKQRGRVGSLLRSGRHAATHGDREDEGDITSSDEFYTASARWDVRKIYRRLVSCLRVVCARRGS